MIIKYNKPLFNLRKHYIKVYLTLDEADYLKDYLEERIDQTAVGELKKGLEKLLK